MDDDEVESRIDSLETAVSNLENKVEELTRFAATLIGRLAHKQGNEPDLGAPDCSSGTGCYDAKLAMILSYNQATNRR